MKDSIENLQNSGYYTQILDSMLLKQLGMKNLQSKVFHETPPQCVGHPFFDQKAHL